MKSPEKSRTARVFKNIFNVRQWSDYDRLKVFTLFVGASIKKVFVPQKIKVSDSKETFKKACTTMHLTKDGLLQRQQALFRLSLLMSALGLAVFSYGIYHLIKANFSAALVSIVVSMIGFALAFRYHFWYYQIREGKLGCTFKEWFQQGLLGKKS